MTGEDRGQELTKGCSHAGGLQAGLTFSRGKVWPGEVTALLIVVLDLKAREFGEADPQGAAAVVDVLSIQRLKHMRAVSAPRGHTPSVCVLQQAKAHQSGSLGTGSFWILQQGLELAVLGEHDDLQHGAELGEDLQITESLQMLAPQNTQGETTGD